MLAGVATMLALEAVRLKRRALVFPMREYERGRVGGHVWLVLGCAIAVVFFEQRLAVLTILGTTLVDPLIGELRGRGYARGAPAVGAVAWAAQAIVWVTLVPLDTPLVLVPVGAAFAVMAEHFDVPLLDDNLTMNLAPLFVMAGLAALLA